MIDTKEEIEKEKESKQKQVSKLNEERSESQKKYDEILEKSNDKIQIYQKYLKELEEWEISLFPILLILSNIFDKFVFYHYSSLIFHHIFFVIHFFLHSIC